LTGPTDPAGPTEPAHPDVPAQPSFAPRPGGRIFSLEGRAAPALYLVGWLATVLGLGIVLIALNSGRAAGFILVVGLVFLSVGLVAAAGSQGIERRAHGTPGYDGPSPFLVLGAAFSVGTLSVILVAIPAVWLGLLVTRSAAADLLSLLVTAGVYAGLVRLLVVGPGALSWADIGLARRRLVNVASDVGWGAAFALPLVVLTLLIATVLSTFLPQPDSPLPVVHGTGFVLNLISGVVVAPIGEELFFRGFATTAWARTMPVSRAIIRAALLFAAVHVLTVGGTTFGDALGRALVAFLTRLPIAIALGWVFVRRRSLYASIGLHGAFNGALLVLTEVATGG
jgi:membrane protease YdiL (CAAX protease family)